MMFAILSSLWWWILMATTILADKITERRILLPYNTGVPTNFTLHISGKNSCYKWSSSRGDIASITDQADNGCSKSAVVSVVTTIPKRQSTVITASDLNTNQQFRCDVEVDVIHRIAIQTTTKEILLGELPEMIKVSAYSEKNDIFNSIGGVPFEWTLKPSEIVRYRSWATTSYSSPVFVDYWESRNLKSSNILVEGIKTGSVTIRASIALSDHDFVESAETNINVIANLLLIPSDDVFMLPGAKINFRAEISKQGPRVVLNFPDKQYYMEVDDITIASLDEENNCLEALKEGHTSLILKDRNMVISPSDILYRRTRTEIYVSRPSYITMIIIDGDNFRLCEDYQYDLQLIIYDTQHHRLEPSNNSDLNLKFDSDYFDILYSSSNKTFFTIRTKKNGSTQLKAELIGAGQYRLAEPLVHSQDVFIYQPIKLYPENVFLPWIETKNSQSNIFKIHVKATGATGIGYKWQSSNISLAVVEYSDEQSSQVQIISQGLPGFVSIRCSDVHNPFIFHSFVRIHIIPIFAIEIVPSILEAAIDNDILLPIAVIGHSSDNLTDKYYFDDCSRVDFDVEIIEKSRISYLKDEIVPGFGSNSCRSLKFRCLVPGNSRIIIKYHTFRGEIISTQTIIGCHKPLKLIQPKEFAVLSLGSSIDVAVEGGPRPWSLYPEGHYSRATPFNNSVVSLTTLKDRYRYNKDLHIFKAYCQQYGESEIDLEVGNSASPTLSNPSKIKTSVKIYCSRPETLIIKPQSKSSCPEHDTHFIVEKNKRIELNVQVFNKEGIEFYNFSTLNLEWSKDASVGMFDKIDSVHEEVNGAFGYSILKRSYQSLSGLKIPKTKIRCKTRGYRLSKHLNEHFNVQHEIDLVLTDSLTIEENSISVLRHPDYVTTIHISRGSGYFDVELTDKKIIDVQILKEDRRKLSIRPLHSGTGILTISDLCLEFYPIAIPYSVVEPSSIEIIITDKMQLGSTVEGSILVLDNRNQKLSSSMHQYLNLTLKISENCVITR